MFDLMQVNCPSVEDYVIAMTEMKVTELFAIGNLSVSAVPFGSHVWPTLTHYSIAGQSVVLLTYERSLCVMEFEKYKINMVLLWLSELHEEDKDI